MQNNINDWESVIQDPNQDHPSILNVAIAKLGKDMEKRFDKVDKTMKDMAKVGQQDFDSMVKKLSDKDK
jgi:hypothetical protein